MSNYMGQSTHSLDAKNRIAVPVKFRNALGESFVLFRAMNGDKCLFLYSMEDWETLMSEVNSRPVSRELTEYQRRIYANLYEVEPDKQGRITLPAEFCKFAGFDREVFVLGAGKRVELWNPSEWDKASELAETRGIMTGLNMMF